MKKIVLIIGAIVLLGLAVLAGTTLFAETTINKASFDCPTVMVTSGSSTVASGNPCWGNSATVEQGNDLHVRVYYHNTGNEIARNVRIKLFPEESSVNKSQQFSASIFSSNGDVVIGTAVVNVKQPTRFTFSGAATWYTNDAKGRSSFLNNQTIDKLFSSDGLFIGDVLPGPEHRGSLVLTYKLTNPNEPLEKFDSLTTFSVGTSPAEKVSDDSAQVRGFVAPRGNVLKVSFEYGETSNLGKELVANTNQVATAEIKRTLNLLDPNTTYFYRFCAESDALKRCGVISSFTTKTPFVAAPVEDKTPVEDVVEDTTEEEVAEEVSEETVVDNTVSIPLEENEISFVYLGIDNGIHTVESNEYVTYTVRYGNTDRNLRKVGMYIDLPKDLEFISTDQGVYIASEHAVAIDEKTLPADLEGSFFIHMRTPVLEGEHVPILATATLTYRNPDSGARETATSYDVDHVYGIVAPVEEVDNSNLAALAGGTSVTVNGFLLILLVLIVALEVVLLTREYPHFLPLVIHPHFKKDKKKVSQDIAYRYQSPNKVVTYYGHLGN